LHADTPPRYLSCDTKKNESSALPDVFLDIFNVESRVTSVAWARAVYSRVTFFPVAEQSCNNPTFML
jgi:hypothetical protein